MSYIKDRNAKRRAESEEFRVAFDEEVLQAERERKRRQALMQALSAVRKASRISQQQMAEAMKISQARVSQIERGDETLSVDRLLDMVAVLQGNIAILTPEEVKQYGLESKVVTHGPVGAADQPVLHKRVKGRSTTTSKRRSGAKSTPDLT